MEERTSMGHEQVAFHGYWSENGDSEGPRTVVFANHERVVFYGSQKTSLSWILEAWSFVDPGAEEWSVTDLSLIHISEPTRLA